MSNRSKQNLFVILLAGALAFGLSSVALAQNTPSGTIITNTATVDYTVATVPQAQVASLPVTFLVDNKVDHELAFVQTFNEGNLMVKVATFVYQDLFT